LNKWRGIFLFSETSTTQIPLAGMYVLFFNVKDGLVVFIQFINEGGVKKECNLVLLWLCTQILFSYNADRLVPITVTIDIVIASSLDLSMSTAYQLYARKSEVMVIIVLRNMRFV